MIDWYASRSHRIDKFFSKVISFGAILQTHSNLMGRQKSDVLIVGSGGRSSPHVILRRPSDPKLREMAELRPCLRKAEQLDARIQDHAIARPEV
jgi:hypothetical protein